MHRPFTLPLFALALVPCLVASAQEPAALTLLRTQYVNALKVLAEKHQRAGDASAQQQINAEITRVSSATTSPVPQAAVPVQSAKATTELEKVAGEKDLWILTREIRPEDAESQLNADGFKLAEVLSIRDAIALMTKLRAAGVREDVVLDLSSDEAGSLTSAGVPVKVPDEDEVKAAFIGGAVHHDIGFVMRLGPPRSFGLSPRVKSRSYLKWLVRTGAKK